MGIGDYVKTGLEAVASEPMCSHVFTVDDLSFVDSALEEIDKSISECKYSCRHLVKELAKVDLKK